MEGEVSRMSLNFPCGGCGDGGLHATPCSPSLMEDSGAMACGDGLEAALKVEGKGLQSVLPTPPTAAIPAADDADTPDIPSGPVDLATLLEHASLQLQHQQHLPLSARHKVKSLLAQYDATTGELDRYAFFDPGKRYTRNLIAQDDHFTLILLCWNPGKESPIHDHPCLGCWMRVVSGTVVETRYAHDQAANRLTETGRAVGTEGATIYIDDSIGLHKVTNPEADTPACTLHLYAPPFHKCKVWLDGDGPADKFMTPTVTYHSEYGTLVSYETESTLCL